VRELHRPGGANLVHRDEVPTVKCQSVRIEAGAENLQRLIGECVAVLK